MAAILYRRICELREGDGFFHVSTSERDGIEQRVTDFDSYLRSTGGNGLSGVDQRNFIESFSGGFIVDAIVRETGERCTTRASDGKRHIWYDGEIRVRVAADPMLLRAELDNMRKVRAKMDEAQSKVNAFKSKKKNAPTETAERTLRQGL